MTKDVLTNVPMLIAHSACVRACHAPAFGLIKCIDPGCTRRISRRSADATRTNLPRMAKNANEVTLSFTRLPVYLLRTISKLHANCIVTSPFYVDGIATYRKQH